MNKIAACLPGVRDVKQIDERTFDGIVEARVGPISGKFSFRAQIVDSDPPRRIVAHMEGTDSVTKSTMNGDTTVTLDPMSEYETGMTYSSTVNIHGRLAILGEMVLRATATLLLEEFIERFKREVESSKTVA